MRKLSDTTCLILGLVSLTCLPACGLLAGLLPWNSTGQTTHEVKDNRDVQLTPANPEPDRHWGCCGGNPEEDTINHDPCDADGKHNDDGDFECCFKCRKVCGPRYRPGASCPNQPRHCYDLKPVGDSPSDGFKCEHCGERCVLKSGPAKPPVPVPVPRRCDPDVHCSRTTKCPISDAGDCCAGKGEDKGCGQPCPPWSGE